MENWQNENNKQIPQNGFLGEITEAKASGLSFTLGLLFYLGLSFIFLLAFAFVENQQIYLYGQYLVSPIAIILLTVCYFLITEKNFKTVAKKQKCHIKYYFIALLLQIGLFSLSELNGYFLTWLEKFGYQPPPIDLPSMDGFGFVGVLFTVAVLPAIFEEIFFRGILLDGCKVFGNLGAVFLCGGLFALYHQNPAQTIYQFCCGAAFALVALRSGSILPTVVSHFINNAVILILTKFGVDGFPLPVFIIVLCVSIPCLIGSLVYLIFFDRKEPEKKTGTKKQFLLGALGGIIICGISWISALFMG